MSEEKNGAWDYETDGAASNRGLSLVTLSIFMCCIFFTPILGCEAREGLAIINENDLQNKIKVGEAVRVSEILNISTGTICVLYPYQPKMADNTPHASQINKYLKENNYIADESHWMFVVVNRDVVVAIKLKRSEKLDILSLHEIKETQREIIPKGFVPNNCASMEQARFAKIEMHNRTFLMLGETK